MKIVGVSAYYHDAAACLVVDGDIVAAAQEERFTRKRHDSAFPSNAISFCLEAAGVAPTEIDFVAFYDKPFPKFERLLETYLAYAPRGFRSFRAAMPIWLRDKLFQKATIRRQLARLWPRAGTRWELLFSEHHLSHAASAFYPSPFEEAAILTMDGVGEWATTSVALGKGSTVQLQREVRFPHSLGLLYSAFTYYAGFKVNSGEYKLMGLAPYGEPVYAQRIRDEIIEVKADGSFRLNMRYFDYCTGLTMVNEEFEQLFGGPARRAAQPLTQRDMDLAASVQTVLEEVVLKIARDVRATTGQRNLCLAGGVALNCVANGKLLRAGIFDEIWIQPAAGDAGGALGAALAAYHMATGAPRKVCLPDAMKGAFLGPAFAQPDIEQRLQSLGAKFRVVSDDHLLDACSEALSAGAVLGWFQGGLEFGPRALGARSLLADPRVLDMQQRLNLKTKHRESFRPFAPSVLREEAPDWFELDRDSPYMLLVADVHGSKRLDRGAQGPRGIDRISEVRSLIPAVTHVDYSARVHTVDQQSNPRFHSLLRRFHELTGCPVLVNTSFNVRGEPIVCTPEDAFRCFMTTGVDVMAVGNCLLRKDEQDPRIQFADAAGFEED